MSKNSENILNELEKKLSGGNNTKALRFLLNCLSSTPIVGGVISAISGIWAESEQNKSNEIIVAFNKMTDQRVNDLEKSLVDSGNPTHIVAGFITFNPNRAELIDSSKISSLADNSVLDFTINFSKSFKDFLFSYYGNGKVVVKEVQEEEGGLGLRVIFEEPCPDRVTFVFYESQQRNEKFESLNH